MVHPLHGAGIGREFAKSTRVAVTANDPLTHAGLVSYLESSSRVVVSRGDYASVDLVVVGVERFTEATFDVLQRISARTGAPVLLVADDVSGSQLLRAARYRAFAVVPRSVDAEGLLRAVEVVVAGGGFLSAALLGDLLKDVGRYQSEVQPRSGSHRYRLGHREIEVLQLLADGFGTRMVAEKLACSERTVKNVVSKVKQELGVRNRAHAIAFSLRAGLI
ncbi:response regulator transcription factor [Amycolatopsis sp. NPDC051061]|uniref:helix-turn-helix transcriptional regulator n=1 Tax=Amycolatopsis sp. NPDC051061 TaxID=3155042 RepID=UPI00344A3D77